MLINPVLQIYISLIGTWTPPQEEVRNKSLYNNGISLISSMVLDLIRSNTNRFLCATRARLPLGLPAIRSCTVDPDRQSSFRPFSLRPVSICGTSRFGSFSIPTKRPCSVWGPWRQTVVDSICVWILRGQCLLGLDRRDRRGVEVWQVRWLFEVDTET